MPVLRNSRHEKFALIADRPGVRDGAYRLRKVIGGHVPIAALGRFNGQPALRRRPYQVRSAPGVPLEDLGWKRTGQALQLA
jgi:hypothetical protein